MPKKSALLSILLPILLAPSFAHADDPLPKDVATYIDRRELCYHLSGEIPDPSEKERLREVIHDINKQCQGLDRKKIQLEMKYAANATVSARLAKLAAETGDGPDAALHSPAH